MAAALTPPPRLYPLEPWGHYRPPPVPRLVLALTRTLALPVVKQLALLLRRTVRGRLGPAVDVGLWGHRLRMIPHGNVAEGRLIFVPRAWDRVERKAIASLLPRGATFVDVGANAGGYTWWVLSLLGEHCTIVAVEPDPELAAGLEFNLRENAVRNVRVEHAAVGTEGHAGSLCIDVVNRGKNVLLCAPDPRDGRGRGQPGAPAAAGAEPGRCARNAVRVPVYSLVEIAARAGVRGIDLLKIDIEGLEPAVLADFFRRADHALWPRVLITEKKDTPEHDVLERRLQEIGYHVYCRTSLNLVCRLQGGGVGPGGVGVHDRA